MKITLSEIVNHGDFKCSKSQKQLRDPVIRVIETISGSRPNKTKEMDSFINLLAMKIIRKKYSLNQLRKLENDWLLSKVIELKEEGQSQVSLIAMCSYSFCSFCSCFCSSSRIVALSCSVYRIWNNGHILAVQGV